MPPSTDADGCVLPLHGERSPGADGPRTGLPLHAVRKTGRLLPSAETRSRKN